MILRVSIPDILGMLMSSSKRDTGCKLLSSNVLNPFDTSSESTWSKYSIVCKPLEKTTKLSYLPISWNFIYIMRWLNAVSSAKTILLSFIHFSYIPCNLIISRKFRSLKFVKRHSLEPQLMGFVRLIVKSKTKPCIFILLTFKAFMISDLSSD